MRARRRLREAGRAAALVLLGLAALSCAAAGSLGRGTPARDLARLETDVRESELAARPDLASRHGDRRGDARLEPVTEASLVAERGRVRSLEERLGRIPREGLSARGAALRDTLAARLAARSAELDSGRWARDPAAYLDLAGGAIEELLPGRTPCARLPSVTRRLRRVPEVLRAARVNLREPEAARVEASLPGYERVLALYRGALPALAGQCREPVVVADLAEADTSAVRAVQEFVDYLRHDLLPRAR